MYIIGKNPFNAWSGRDTYGARKRDKALLDRG